MTHPGPPPLLLALAVITGAAGCETGLYPDLGPRLSDRCRDRDGDPDHDVSFSVDLLEGIFRASQTCLPCHDPKGSNPLGWQGGGLDLSSYSGLLAGGVNSAADIVVPGRPCSSRLLLKLGASPPGGSRMPLSGAPLPGDQRARIHDWIAEGAVDN